MTHLLSPRRSASAAPRPREEGAAMLMVLMVLLMTTATATFAIHATMTEMRSAGYGRQAIQTSYVAEGAAYAGLSYIDAIGPQATFLQYTRTQVASTTPYVPGATSVDRQTNLLRIRMEDFVTAVGVSAPPLELDATHASLGSRSAYVPSFLVDGTDLYRTFRQEAGRDQSGRDPMAYVRLNLTSRGTMGLPTGSDVTLSGDLREYHETVVSARAMTEMGPFGGGF